MLHRLVIALALLVSVRLFGAEKDDAFKALVRTTEALSPDEERVRLKVPPGFEVQLFASEPMINKPINLAFDARGRLWVSSTTEYPFAAATNRWEDAQGSRVRGSRDAIKILEDTDGDGRADKATDFADGLNIPIGVLPYGRGCIAWSVPNLWYFEDTDGDGKCDRRTVLFGPLGYERDVHGNIASLRLGPDGWIYATHGFNNTSRLEVRPEKLGGRKLGDPGTVLEMNSGNVFRFRPDGSAVEIWTRGQVNPFGLCFDRFGQLYSADCHSDPLMQLLRGSTYPSFGKPHDGLGFAPVMCPHRHNSTGLCGLVHVHGGVWGAEWDDQMLLGNVVTSRINRDHVKFTGATARAEEQEDFLVSEDPWFRPVDLQLGPDGALYVADFYNKIIGHYEVDRHHPGRDRERGRIWRIVKSGATKPGPLTREQKLAQDWRWKENEKASWSQSQQSRALSLLNDAKFDARVRRQVAETVAFHPDARNIPKLVSLLQKTPAEDEALRHTLRVALRNHLELPGAFIELAKARASDVELLPVMRAVQNPAAAAWLMAWLERQAGEPGDLLPTLTTIARRLRSEDEERFVRMVQRRFANEENSAALLGALREGLSAQPGGPQSTAMFEWASDLAGRLLTQIESKPGREWTAVPPASKPAGPSPWGLDQRTCSDGKTMAVLSSSLPPRGGAIEQRTGSLVSRPFACPPWLVFWICGHRGPPKAAANDLSFARLVDDAGGAELARAYPPRNDVAQRVEWNLAAHADQRVRLELVDGDSGKAYAWLAIGRLTPPVLKLEPPHDDEPLAAAAEIIGAFRQNYFAPRLAAQLERPDLSEATRLKLAATLGRFPGQSAALAGVFKTAPTRLQLRLAEALASTREGAAQLCDLAPPRLLAAASVAQKITVLNDAGLSARVRELTKSLPPAEAETEALLAARLKSFEQFRAAGKANAELGEKIYQANCAVCHRIGGVGGVVGPQLDGAKNRGAERLCEDILDPNRAVDPAFRVLNFTLKDESVLTGLIRRDLGSALVLADSAGQERTVPKAEIASRAESALSLMPSNVGELISEDDFNHLLAWLLSK
ncbi:MAG: c-type cytochrome [Verrucomicrobia bacterium]|nr:c-type cytochrome [Verrucomicrobiota bacterium]